MSQRPASLLAVLFFFLSAVFSLNASAGQEESTRTKLVRVGYFPFDGYHMTDAVGRKSGYGYEYLQRIRTYTGWKYVYIGEREHLYWADMFRLLDAGTIDVLTSVSKTEEREKKYAFSETPIGVKSTILTVKAGNTRYAPGKYAEWNGMKIGMLARNSQNQKLADFARESGFTYTPVFLSSSKEQVEHLQSGAVDAILSSDLRRTDHEWIVASFSPTPFYIVTQKGNTALMKEINRALERIKASTQNIDQDLYKKYYTPDLGEQLFFSASERAYLDQHKKSGRPLRVLVNPDSYPYSFFKDGLPQGSLVDLSMAFFTRAGLEVNFLPAADNEAYWRLVRKGEADVILAAHNDYNLAETYGYLLCDPYYTMSLSVLSVTNRPLPSVKKTALVEDGGFIQHALLKEKIDPRGIIYFDSSAECVEAVATGLADQALLYTNTAQQIVRNDPTKRFSSSKYPQLAVDISLAVNEAAGSTLAAILNKVSTSFSEQELAKITTRYFNLPGPAPTLTSLLYEYPLWFLCIAVCLAVILGLVFFAVSAGRNTRKMKTMNEILRKALDAAERANGSKSRFLAQISHEIRTPMNAIIGLTAIAKTEAGDTQKVYDYLSKIESSSKVLLSIINDVLDMSAIEGGKMKIEHSAFNFKKQLTSIAAIAYQQAKLKNITFDVRMLNITDEILQGDELRLTQILMNLLSNAMKFTQAEGWVLLSVTQTSRTQSTLQLRFSVADTGCGMSEDMQERLFKPFEQESTSTARKHGGSGLGLSITKELVELMGGSIQVQSEQGKGTTFSVDLPFGVSEDQVTEAPDRFTDIRTLVVDDDPEACTYISLLLTRLGVRHDLAQDGETALEMLGEAEDKDDPYTLCILDWQMPKMSGGEVTRQIRKIFGDETIVIIISSFDPNEIEEEGRVAGANSFISKPLFQSAVFDTLMRISRGSWKAENVLTSQEKFIFQGKNVLVAEDVALNMEVAIKLLKMVGIEVTCAEDGQQAVSLYENAPDGYYDCILLDINMPVMDGYDAARHIRASTKPDAKTVPLYAMTANAFTEVVTAALDAGMNGHIAKPIETKVLYSTLRNAFRGDVYEQI